MIVRTDRRSGDDHPETGARSYAIRVGELVPVHWAAWLGTSGIRHESDGSTTLHLPPRDQAGLHGALTRVRDLGLTILTVTSAPGPPPRSTTGAGSPRRGRRRPILHPVCWPTRRRARTAGGA